MDIDEEETARTPNKLKIEEPGKLVHIAKAQGKMKTVKFKVLAFEVQEYKFISVPKEVVNKYKSKVELLDSYKYSSEKYFDEKLKLCDRVKKFPSQNTSLATIRDQARGTLNLVVIT